MPSKCNCRTDENSPLPLAFLDGRTKLLNNDRLPVAQGFPFRHPRRLFDTRPLPGCTIMLDHVLLWLNGRRHEVRGRDVFLSLSDFIRRTQGLTGTKIVCSEGDCGACSVLIGRPAEEGDRLVYRPVDSCIQFVFQLDGAHVITVEGLGGEAEPSPVQRAMIEHHGSQCGFCTPGFVVAMTGLLEDCDELDESTIRCGLSGNLCRCTGYMPIIDAGLRVDVTRHRRMEQTYPSAPMLSENAQRRGQPIEVGTEWDETEHLFASPPDLEERRRGCSARARGAGLVGRRRRSDLGWYARRGA